MSQKSEPTSGDAVEARRAANVARQMFLCLDVFRDRVLAKLQRKGHTSVRWSDGTVLRYVRLDGTPLSEIARRAHVSRQAIAKTGGELAAMGYLKIVPDRGDGRAKVARFTAKGRKLAAVITSVNEEVEREFAEVIGQRKLDALRSTLTRMLDAKLPPP